MKFITFSGVDGSGKSSQLERFKQKLEKSGKKVAYFHAVEFSLANRLNRLYEGRREPFTPGSEKAVTRASYISILLREVFLLCDILRFHFLLGKLARRGYDYLLSDRSFYDSLINIAYLKQSKPFVKLYSFWLSGLLPQADLAFYLDLDPSVAMERERVPEQGLEYLQTKRELYRKKIDAWHLHVINANESKETVFESLWKMLVNHPKYL